jgi:hypothetical protein
VLQGGALLQSAMKRAANEGVQKANDEQTLARQLAADATQEQRVNEGNEANLGKLALSNAREQNNIYEFQLPYTKQNALDLQEGINRLKAKEAATGGFVLTSPTTIRRAPAKQPAGARRASPPMTPNYIAKAKRRVW